jgi:hypothetical protein
VLESEDPPDEESAASVVCPPFLPISELHGQARKHVDEHRDTKESWGSWLGRSKRFRCLRSLVVGSEAVLGGHPLVGGTVLLETVVLRKMERGAGLSAGKIDEGKQGDGSDEEDGRSLPRRACRCFR